GLETGCAGRRGRGGGGGGKGGGGWAAPSPRPPGRRERGLRVARLRSGSWGTSHRGTQLGQGAGPQFFHAIQGAVHAASHFGEAQAFQVAEDDDLAIVRGQPAQVIRQQDGQLMAGRLLAGRAATRGPGPGPEGGRLV